MAVKLNADNLNALGIPVPTYERGRICIVHFGGGFHRAHQGVSIDTLILEHPDGAREPRVVGAILHGNDQ